MRRYQKNQTPGAPESLPRRVAKKSALALLAAALTGATLTASAQSISYRVLITESDEFVEHPAYTVGTQVDTGANATPGSRSVLHGDTTTFSVNLSTGYVIEPSGVSGCGASLEGTTVSTGEIRSDCVVHITPELDQYLVTAEAVANGSVSPEQQEVEHGSQASVSLSPDTDYQIAGASGCDGSLSGDTYTTGAVTTSCTVTAEFEIQPPGSVSGLTATDDQADHIALSWSEADRASSYRIQRRGSGDSYSNLTEVGSPGYTDSSVTFAETYDYRVRAENETGESGWVTVQGATLEKPDAPSDLTASDGEYQQVQLNWTGSSDADEYVIRRDGSYVTAVTDTTYTDTGLADDTTYNYEVRSRNDAGESEGGTTANGTTLGAPDEPGNVDVELQ